MFCTFYILTVSFAVYACIKWWFDTSITDHIVSVLSFGKFLNFAELKISLTSRSTRTALLVELFECPWCLSFHFSFWWSLFFWFSSDHFEFGEFIIQVVASAGGGMFLWQLDLKD